MCCFRVWPACWVPPISPPSMLLSRGSPLAAVPPIWCSILRPSMRSPCLSVGSRRENSASHKRIIVSPRTPTLAQAFQAQTLAVGSQISLLATTPEEAFRMLALAAPHFESVQD
jgi:hypothetical protein